ncbi:MAG: hypothetical protein Q9169_002557 [Polycauliona sp. 2 TL-2023]
MSADSTGMNRPPRLLDLPLDILKDIVKEVSQVKYSNDLTSLARTCSALNDLATPWIYTRFDIIWPDAGSLPDSNQAVDALTYGLATLVTGGSLFDSPTRINQTPANSSHIYTCEHCHKPNAVPCISLADPQAVSQRRTAIHYPQYTREFSLGNGHVKWIDRYTIDKESGKMLGTLVALALARMPNLEAFIWDMRTGILRDCWRALGSLNKPNDDNNRSFQKVWVRFHDNSNIISTISPDHMTLPNIVSSDSSQTQWRNAIKGDPTSNRLLWSYGNVEWPSFSILPALRSLNVLDIDELAYLEEMSWLVGRSIESLRELRVGFAVDVPRKGFTSTRLFNFPGDHSELTTYKGGLGLLLSKIHMFSQERRSTASELLEAAGTKTLPVSASATPEDTRTSESCKTYRPLLTPAEVDEEHHQTKGMLNNGPLSVNLEPTLLEPKRLRLEVLELERVNVAVPMLWDTIDWSFLTSLTLLSCDGHEKLWKSLRRTYAPRSWATTESGSSLFSARRKNNTPAPRIAAALDGDEIPHSKYRLRLRNLHTNNVSSALMSFLKDTLAPNSLETLILQDGGMVELDGSQMRGYYESTITVDQICKGPLRRHRSSLRKVVIDSNHRTPTGTTRHHEWRKWKCDRDCLSYLTSGKMSVLRELSLSLDYKDWHFFLQRLPQIPYVRSIYVTNMTDHAHGHHLDMKELALQIMDIVALRPEIELCYIGIINKCFEIQEGKYNSDSSTISFHSSDTGGPTSHTGSLDGSDDDNGSDVEDDEEDEDEDGDFDGHHAGNGGAHSGNSGSEDEISGESEEESEDDYHKRGREPKMKLREIVFYDEKIEIFKARHAKL